MREYFLGVLHNCVAHLIIAFLPNSHYAFEFHALTEKWLNEGPIRTLSATYNNKSGSYGVRYVYWQSFDYRPVKIKSKVWWWFNNAIAHLFVGLLPVKMMTKVCNWSEQKAIVK